MYRVSKGVTGWFCASSLMREGGFEPRLEEGDSRYYRFWEMDDRRPREGLLLVMESF